MAQVMGSQKSKFKVLGQHIPAKMLVEFYSTSKPYWKSWTPRGGIEAIAQVTELGRAVLSEALARVFQVPGHHLCAQRGKRFYCYLPTTGIFRLPGLVGAVLGVPQPERGNGEQSSLGERRWSQPRLQAEAEGLHLVVIAARARSRL